MRIFKEPFTVFSVLAVSIFLLSILVSVLKFNSLPAEIVLRFNNVEGVKTFGPKTDLIGIIAIIGVILIINFILSEVLFHRNRVLVVILLAANFLISLLTLISISVIISVN